MISTASLSSHYSLTRPEYPDSAYGSATTDSGSNNQVVTAIGERETIESQVLPSESGPDGAVIPFDNSIDLFAMINPQSAGLEGLSIPEAQLDLDDYIRSLPLEEYDVEDV
jgi:hypothetical protein